MYYSIYNNKFDWLTDFIYIQCNNGIHSQLLHSIDSVVNETDVHNIIKTVYIIVYYIYLYYYTVYV